MSSRRRKLPPWLSGVSVSKKNKSGQQDEISMDPKDEKINTVANKMEDGKESNSVKPNKTGQRVTENAERSVGPEKDGQIVQHKCMSVEALVGMSYPEYSFKGSIVYSHHQNDCNVICEDIVTSLHSQNEPVIGFDSEWPVTYQKGSQAKTALLQICVSDSKCYLFHISCMGQIPVMLKKLLESEKIKKVGVNVEYDFWKLEADYDIRVKSIIQTSVLELGKLANKKLKSTENWSLEGLAKNVLHVRISKDPSVRKCDWSQFPLPEIQKTYAATDASVSLLLYQKLSERKA